jgi:predicted DCC family thiol-disulfide oxidoreductase YuxK
MLAVVACSAAQLRSARPARAGRWTVLYDGECGLCAWMLARLLAWDREELLAPCALQRPAAASLLAELTPEQRMGSWHLIAPDGTRRSGAAALAALLRLLPGGALAAPLLERTPRLSERAYRFVAAHRAGLSRLLPARSKRSARKLVLDREARCGPPRDA